MLGNIQQPDKARFPGDGCPKHAASAACRQPALRLSVCGTSCQTQDYVGPTPDSPRCFTGEVHGRRLMGEEGDMFSCRSYIGPATCLPLSTSPSFPGGRVIQSAAFPVPQPALHGQHKGVCMHAFCLSGNDNAPSTEMLALRWRQHSPSSKGNRQDCLKPALAASCFGFQVRCLADCLTDAFTLEWPFHL